jgi:DNA-binding MarR family transcriptional regulator
MTVFTIESADRLRRAIGDSVRAIQRTENTPAGQLEALGFLSRDGAQTVAQLARLRRVRHQSMSGTVAELEAQGLVSRTSDPVDGRSILVRLTDAGSAVIDESRLRRSGMILRAAEHTLTDDERATLALTADLLTKLTAGLSSE